MELTLITLLRRLTVFSLFFLLVPSSVFAFATSNCATLSRNLKVGMTGNDVRVLQVLLNKEKITQIAAIGPGAPGFETTYFGEKTRDAVMRFQGHYASEVLFPLGLNTGNGFVGAYSRSKLLKICSPVVSHEEPPPPVLLNAPTSTPAVSSQTPITVIHSTSTPSVSKLPFTPLSPNMKIPQGVNPNSINLEYSLELIRQDGKKHGISDDKIEQEIGAIREVAATTTDLAKEFFAKQKFTTTNTKLEDLTGAPVSLGAFFLKGLSFLGLGTSAEASLGTPFGGLISFVFPCTCTGGTVWGTVIAPPLPPTYPVRLDVTIGTQLYLNYNIPLEGIYMLGFYEPGVQACYMYFGVTCAPIPSYGWVTPFVGSSLL